LEEYRNFATRHALTQTKNNSDKIGDVYFKHRNRLKQVFIIVRFPLLVIQFIRIFKISNFDHILIVNGGYPGGVCCQAASIAWWLNRKKKSVFSFHNYSANSLRIRRMIESPIDILVSRSIGTLVSVSNDCLNSIYNRPFFKRIKNKRVVFNGIEDLLEHHHPNSGQIINLTKPYTVMIGTFEARKGHSFLLKSFQWVADRNAEVSLHIAGKGNVDEELRIKNEVLALGLQDRVYFHGFVETVVDLIANSSALLVPSQDYESFGLTIVEAMAMGIPVVATNVGGIPEVLEDGGGLVVSKDDTVEFGKAVLKIIEHKKEAQMIAAAGRKQFEIKFSSELMAKNYREILISVNK
jgi:glycosyltransferase involved in cell wall biosynthesis